MSEDIEIVSTDYEYPVITYTIRQQIADSDADRYRRLNAFVDRGRRDGNDVLVMTDGMGWNEPRRYWMRPLRAGDV